MPAPQDQDTEFERLRRTWTELGDLDPLWAILSDPAKAGGRWDLDEFLRSGEADLAQMMAALDDLGLEVAPGSALDFGCGVGRVTQAMARRFARCHGVDVAETMIEQAERLNRAPDRCTYHHNPRPDLSLFDDASFDFVYSVIVLQHMAPAMATGYVREFLRVVRPGGIVAFQLPSERVQPTGAPGITRGEAPLPDGGFRATVDVVTPGRRLRRLPAGTGRRITVRVHNRGDATWPALGTADGRFWVNVANQWLDEDRGVVRQDDGRAGLSADVRPGESLKLRLPVTAPGRPGRYLLALDVVQEGVCWFHERGSEVTLVPVEVTGPARDPEPPSDGKPTFEMHGVPRDEVERLVAAAGGRTLAVLPDDSAGDAWVSWLYVATRGTVPAGA